MTWEDELLQICEQLSAQNRMSVLSFAGYLANQSGEVPSFEITAPTPKVLVVPEIIERPEGESSVAALKRLATTYPMLDKNVVMEKSASLVMSHMMQGRDKKEVVDDLEKFFSEEYAAYKAAMEAELS